MTAIMTTIHAAAGWKLVSEEGKSCLIEGQIVHRSRTEAFLQVMAFPNISYSCSQNAAALDHPSAVFPPLTRRSDHTYSEELCSTRQSGYRLLGGCERGRDSCYLYDDVKRSRRGHANIVLHVQRALEIE